MLEVLSCLQLSNLLQSDDNLVSSIRTTDTQVIIQNLEPCTSYWTTVTAVNCGTKISSTPQLIGLKDPTSYQLVANLASSVGPCSTWITVNTARKVTDVENGLRLPLVLCGYTIPCFANSQWSCVANDPTKAIFRYKAKRLSSSWICLCRVQF